MDINSLELENLIKSLKGRVENLEDKVINTTYIANNIYPIGSIYISMSDSNPSTLFGGTWEQLKDVFLFGIGDTYHEIGLKGGEFTHTLTIEEMPRHRHTISTYNNNATGLWEIKATNATGDSGGKTTEYDGGGEAHNNMPPFIVVYIWKRIA